MLRVGLTGGIASGKSHVLRRLAAAGLPTLDLDRLSRDVLAPGRPGQAAVVAAFGPSLLASDGTLDRKALGRIVFADEDARLRLNAIVHPLIRRLESERAQSLESSGASLLVTDGALLVESGIHLRFDRLVVVHCQEEQQLARLMRRDAIDPEAAWARLRAQMPTAEKRRFGHFTIDTSARPEDTDALADALARELLAAVRRAPSHLDRPVERAAGMLEALRDGGPRGLHPARLLKALSRAPSVEMEALRLLLEPPKSGPWYLDEALAIEPLEAAVLATSAAAWCLARRGGPEIEHAAPLAASLGRLLGAGPRDVATVCLAVLSLLQALGAPMEADPRPLSSRWGGAEPRDDVLVALDPALRAAASGLAGSRHLDQLRAAARGDW